MNSKKLKIACLCGKTIGKKVCQFLLEQDVLLKVCVNDYEKPDQWYETPRSLEMDEISLDEVVSFEPDLIVVAFYDTILKENIFSMPRLGCWNLHLGDVHKYRGAYPNVRALENGDREYRVTLHQIDSGIDSGPVLAQKSFEISPDDCGKRLYDKMTEAGSKLFTEQYEKLISGEALQLAKEQGETKGELFYREQFTREICVLEEVRNQVLARTFPPFPPPYFMVGNRKFIITEEQDHR